MQLFQKHMTNADAEFINRLRLLIICLPLHHRTRIIEIYSRESKDRTKIIEKQKPLKRVDYIGQPRKYFKEVQEHKLYY